MLHLKTILFFKHCRRFDVCKEQTDRTTGYVSWIGRCCLKSGQCVDLLPHCYSAHSFHWSSHSKFSIFFHATECSGWKGKPTIKVRPFYCYWTFYVALLTFARMSRYTICTFNACMCVRAHASATLSRTRIGTYNRILRIYTYLYYICNALCIY